MDQRVISAVTSALAAGTCATASSAGAGSGAAVATGGSDCTLTGFGVAVGVAVAARRGGGRRMRAQRLTGLSGNGLRASAASAWAVTQTGVWRLVRE